MDAVRGEPGPNGVLIIEGVDGHEDLGWTKDTPITAAHDPGARPPLTVAPSCPGSVALATPLIFLGADGCPLGFPDV